MQVVSVVAFTHSVGVLYHIFMHWVFLGPSVKDVALQFHVSFLFKNVLLGDWGEKFKYQLYGQND